MTATVRKAAPRKAPPRKATKRPTNGSAVKAATNGHAVDEDGPALAAPERVPDHPYGDVALFTYEKPSDGGRPIIFPHIGAVKGVYYLFWKIRKQKLSPMDMTYEWMDAAGVPDAVQERVVKLPDAEMGQFFKSWFAGAIEPPEVLPGES